MSTTNVSPSPSPAPVNDQFVKEEMSKEQIQQRDKILSGPYDLPPQQNKDLPTLQFDCRAVLESFTKHLQNEQFYCEEPIIDGSTAIHIRLPSYPRADLDLEFPVKSTAFLGRITDLMLLSFFSQPKIKEALEQNLFFQRNVARQLDDNTILEPRTRDILLRNYLEVIPITSRDKAVLCQIKFGDKIQLTLPFSGRQREYLSNLDQSTVSVFGNWMKCHVTASKAIQERRVEILNPPKVRKLAQRRMLYQSKGFGFSNEGEVKEGALQHLLQQYDLKVRYEKSRPLPGKPLLTKAYEEYLDSHFPDFGIDRVIDFTNWVSMLLELPEPTQHYQTLARLVATSNPLADFIRNKPLEITQNVMNWIHGILFVEWVQANPLTTGYDLSTVPQVTVTNELTPHYVTLGRTPLELITRLVRSWETLEKECDAKQAESLTNILKSYKCSHITFNKRDKVIVCEVLVGSVKRGPLPRAMQRVQQDPKAIYELVKGIVDEKLIRIPLLQLQLVPLLKAAKDGFEPIVQLCEKGEELSPSEILALIKLLSDEEYEGWVRNKSVVDVLSGTLLLLLEQCVEKPSTPHLQAIQKLVILMQRKKVMTPENNERTLSLLITLLQQQQKELHHENHLTIACEFLCSMSFFRNKPKEFEGFCEVLGKTIMSMLPKLLSELNDPEKEKAVYQCAFAILTGLSKEVSSKVMPDLFEKLVANAIQKHSGKVLEEFRNRRLQLLSQLVKFTLDETAQSKLQRYILNEIIEILRHTLKAQQVADLEKLGNILLTFNPKMACEAVNLNKRENFIPFLKILISISSKLDESITDELFGMLEKLRPGAGKANALMIIAELVKNRSEESCKKALDLYEKWISYHLDDDLQRSEIALLQTETLIQMLNIHFFYLNVIDDKRADLLLQQLIGTLQNAKDALKDIPQAFSVNLVKLLENLFKIDHAKPKAFSVIAQVAGFLDEVQIQALRNAVFEFNSLVSVDVRLSLFSEFLQSDGRKDTKFVEAVCLSLLEVLKRNSHQLKIEKLYGLLLRSGCLDALSADAQIEIHLALISLKGSIPIVRDAWDRLPSDHILIRDVKYRVRFVNIFANNYTPELSELIYMLFQKSGKKDLILYLQYLLCNVNLKCDRKTLVKLLADANVILAIKDEEHEYKEMADSNVQPLGYFKAQIFQYLFRYGFKISQCEKAPESRKIADSLSPFRQPLQHYIKKYIPGVLAEINNIIFNVCRFTHDEAVILELGKMCLTEPCDEIGQNAVIFLTEILLMKSVSSREIHQLALKLIKKAIEEKKIELGSPQDILLQAALIRVDNFATLKQVITAFKVFESLVDRSETAQGEEKEAKSNAAASPKARLVPHSEAIMPMTLALAKFGKYKKVVKLAAYAKRFRMEARWQEPFIHVCTLLINSAKQCRDPLKFKELLERYELLLPLFCTYSSKQARTSVGFLSAFAWNFKTEPWMAAQLEKILIITSIAQLYAEHPNEEGSLTQPLIGALCAHDDPNNFAKAVDLFCRYTDRLVVIHEFIELFPKIYNDSLFVLNFRVLLSAMASSNDYTSKTFLPKAMQKLNGIPNLAHGILRMLATQVVFCLHIRKNYLRFRSDYENVFDPNSHNEEYLKIIDNLIPPMVAKYSELLIASKNSAGPMTNLFEFMNSQIKRLSNAAWDRMTAPECETLLVTQLCNALNAFHLAPVNLPSNAHQLSIHHTAFLQQLRNILQVILTEKGFQKYEEQYTKAFQAWVDSYGKKVEQALGPSIELPDVDKICADLDINDMTFAQAEAKLGSAQGGQIKVPVYLTSSPKPVGEIIIERQKETAPTPSPKEQKPPSQSP